MSLNFIAILNQSVIFILKTFKPSFLFCFRLQKFKMNIANTVISQENASLASMGTDQLLDLFELGSDGKGKGASGSQSETTQKPGMKAMLESIGELWDEGQYDSEYNLDNFMQSLRK